MSWNISGTLRLRSKSVSWSINDGDLFYGGKNKFTAYRTVDIGHQSKLSSGFLSKNGNIVCAFITKGTTLKPFYEGDIIEPFYFDNLIDAIKICEQDRENIENGIIKNHIDPEMENLEKSVEENHEWKPECFYFVIIEQCFSCSAAEILAFIPKWIFVNDKIDVNALKKHKHGYHDFYCRSLDMEVVDGCLYSVSLEENHPAFLKYPADLTKELIKLGFTEKPEMEEQIKKIYKLK